ncbi:hypothetical protein H4S04_003163 [Coemansia sp. S16]|nr:hypothetical protein H4S04_003163 [Coemansia sp. S16]
MFHKFSEFGGRLSYFLGIGPRAGKVISAADDPNKIVIAVADAMTALNAAYVKCMIIRINISDLIIQYQEMADRIKGGLEEVGYASYAGGSPDATKAEAPEMMLPQSTCSLKRCSSDLVIAANEKRSHLDTACHGAWVKLGRRNPCDSLDLHDPLTWRGGFVEEIVAELLRIVEQYRRDALVALGTTGSPTAVRAEQSVGPLKKRK